MKGLIFGFYGMHPVFRYFVFLRLSGKFGLVPFTPDCYKVVIKDWKKEK